jgi:hypothetical protein
MLELIASLLVALSVAVGGQGIGSAIDHAPPDGNSKATDAIEAIITRVSAAVQAQEAAGQQPDTTGLDRASDVADEHAAGGLEKASEVAGQAGGATPADAPDVDAPPVGTPPIDVPPVAGPPATHPPIAVPPVPAPPVDAPGLGNRP